MAAADDLRLSTRIFADMVKETAYLAEGNENTRQTNVIRLGTEIVYGIVAAYKNGSAITITTHYTWTLYRPNVVLVSNPAANDHFLFRIKTTMSDDDLDEHLDKAKNDLLTELRGSYEAAEDIDLLDSFLEMVRDIAAGRLIQLRTAGIALENARYRTGRQMEQDAFARARRIRNGAASLLDNDNEAVERKDGALVGGFQHADGAITQRGDWWARLADYQTTIFTPSGQAST